jgi:hypothetical protein
MRYLILTAPGSPRDDHAMTHYQDELVRAGVLLVGDLAAGFWLLEVDSAAAAREWARRLPRNDVEIREVTSSR